MSSFLKERKGQRTKGGNVEDFLRRPRWEFGCGSLFLRVQEVIGEDGGGFPSSLLPLMRLGIAWMGRWGLCGGRRGGMGDWTWSAGRGLGR